MKNARTKKQRNTLAKKISALAKSEPLKALSLANHGHDGEHIGKTLADEPKRGSLELLIQDWLFLEAQRTEPKLRGLSDSKDIAHARKQLEIQTAQIFGDRITAQDSEFFRYFATLLKQGVKFRDAATDKLKDGVCAELLAHKIAGTVANLSEIARAHGVTPRRAWEINKGIGAKTLGPGKPSKIGHISERRR